MNGKLPAAEPDAVGELPAAFEEAMTQLEELVRRMEGGELSLEASLAAYRRGAALVAVCRRSLADVQQQVRVLEGDLLKAFEPEGGDAD